MEKCKFCDAELEEEVTLCPACGKDNAQDAPAETEEKETVETVEAVESTTEEIAGEAEAAEAAVETKPKKKTWKIVVAAICAAVVLVGAAVAVLLYHNGFFAPKDDTPAGKPSYVVEGDALSDAMDDVIATMEGRTLTNDEFQVYYWMQVYNFLEYYGSQTGIDLTKPLAEQTMSGETSWEQYFVDLALVTWKRYQILCIEAEKANFVLDEEVKQSLAEMADNLEASAKNYGFEDAEEMIKADMGPGCSLQAYMGYMEDYYLGVYYFNTIYEQMDPSEEDVSKYFDEHAEDFKTQYGITKESGKLVDVRHILLEPEGATKDSSGYVTATDDQWEACRVKAQALLDSWKAGDATEDAFAKLANEHSTDGGSNTNGGLYTQVPTGYMVKDFDAWMFDESRQVGDTGLVKTEFGYHIMFYSGGQEGWLIYGRDALISELCSQELDAMSENTKVDIDYEAIALGQADINANVQ